MQTTEKPADGPERGVGAEANVMPQIGSVWRNDCGDRVTIVGPGLAGMPEVELEDGTTYYEDRRRLAAV